MQVLGVADDQYDLAGGNIISNAGRDGSYFSVEWRDQAGVVQIGLGLVNRKTGLPQLDHPGSGRIAGERVSFQDGDKRLVLCQVGLGQSYLSGFHVDLLLVGLPGPPVVVVNSGVIGQLSRVKLLVGIGLARILVRVAGHVVISFLGIG